MRLCGRYCSLVVLGEGVHLGVLVVLVEVEEEEEEEEEEYPPEEEEAEEEEEEKEEEQKGHKTNGPRAGCIFQKSGPS